ncbi:MAG: N-6 DNA methylase [Armatimonadota bacterium]
MNQNPHQKALLKLVEACRYRYDLWNLWRDACEMWALAISNAVDLRQYDARECRYLEIIGHYDKETQARFPQMLGELVMAMEGNFDDILGQTFMELELSSKWKGQFFTPSCIASLMARLTLEDITPFIEQRGFITVQEPAVGGGVTVLALAEAMAQAGYDYQRQLHVTAIDIDATCCHMSYIQFALHYLPAVVVHGDTLRMEERGHWLTPAHVLDGWDWKLRRRDERPTEPMTSSAHEQPACVETPVSLPAVTPDIVLPSRQLSLFEEVAV